MKVVEKSGKVLQYLQERNLVKSYIKAKLLLENGDLQSASFKKRRPKHLEIYYFRINKKYRAIGRFKGDQFVVTEISDHQE
ncbi:MAG: hypothetical protein RIE86_08150 [Imperialibacter sp.]|uniref:hypothetical protein n=1 Tax=Imperialibacter sp. TaxID=2038411 RepID=UPI0032F09A13